MEVLEKYNFIPFSEAMKNKLFNKVMLFNLKACICQLMYLCILNFYLQFFNRYNNIHYNTIFYKYDLSVVKIYLISLILYMHF